MENQNLENKKNPLSIVNKILGYGFKISVIALFIFLFIGFINPARISENNSRNVSLVKSAFYFRSYVEKIVSIEGNSSDDLDNPFAAMNSELSYEDQLAAFMNMANDFDDDVAEDDAEEDDYGYADFLAMGDDDFGGLADDSDEDDDSPLVTKAEKIKAQNFKKIWVDFKENNPEVADAFSYGKLASILTFFAVIVAMLGVFVACGTNKFKKIGLCIVCVGSVLICASMANFPVAYLKLTQAAGAAAFSPMAPKGIPVFIVFSVVTFAMALAILILDRKSSVENQDVKTEKSVLSAVPFQYTYRILAILLFILLFIPGANPARISENISRNVSLFTSGFVYNVYTKNMQRILIRGWLPEYVMRLSFFSSMFCCLGILACSVGACMSVGNNKLKRLAHYCILGGSAVSFVSIFGILRSYTLISSSPNVDRILPLQPASATMFLVLMAIIFICALVSYLLTPAPLADEGYYIDAPYQLFLMLLPFLLLVFIFSYLPLWGWRYAFFDYSAGDTLSMDNFVGLKWFKAPFENAATRSDIVRVLRNTLVMSGLGIAFSWLPMVFAIFLSEIKNTTTRKIVQTLTTVPNFISWVLVYAIAFCIFGTEGFISSLFVNKGIWDKGRNMLMGDHFIWLKMWAWGTWKGLGWSAIMYIAAISGIDQQLYEAATVDGAGRFQKIWHITIPELLPTYLVLLILSVSGILSNGMDQYLCFKNPTNKDPIEVLDLYVYQITFGQNGSGNIPFSTVVSMFKSLISVILLFITNRISKWIRGTSIF